MWSTGEGNGKPLQYSCLENPMNSKKRQKDRTPKDERPRSVCVCVLVAWSCPTLCSPIDGSPPGLSIHGILQERTMEWAAISFSKRNYRKKESEVAQSCPTLCNPMDCSPPGSSIHGIFQARVLEWVAISFSAPGR